MNILIIHNTTQYSIDEDILTVQLERKKNDLNEIVLNDNFLEKDFEFYLNFLQNSDSNLTKSEYLSLKEIINIYGPKNLLNLIEKQIIEEENIIYNHFLIYNTIKYEINYQKMIFFSEKYEKLFLNNSKEIFSFKFHIDQNIFIKFLNIIHNDSKILINENLYEIYQLIIFFECFKLKKYINFLNNEFILKLYLNKENIIKEKLNFEIINNFENIIEEKFFFQFSLEDIKHFFLLFAQNKKLKF